MAKQITVAFTMEQAEALLAEFGKRSDLSTDLLNALDAIESTIVNEHEEVEDEEDEPYDQEHDDAYWDHHEYDEDEMRNHMFADPGGNSALRAASKDNPRNLPCPTCHRPNLLTPADRALGYQCDRCSDRAERGVDY